jgi:hypothetical protein
VLLPVPPDVQLVVVTDSIPAGLIDSVSEFLTRSGTLLVAPPSVDAVESLRRFLPVNFVVTEANVNDYAMLSTIEFEHPLFSAFSDARFADFSSIRFWQHRNLQFSEEDRRDGDWSIVAKFDKGLPAIADIRVGNTGRLLLLATGWHPADSQLALSTRFPALLTRILSLASPAQKNQIIQTVGDVIRPGELVSSVEWTVIAPDGEATTASDVSAADESDLMSTTFTLNGPGRYTVTGRTEANEDYSVTLIAILAAAESRTEVLPVGQLQLLGVGVESVAAPNVDVGDADREKSNGQLSANDLEEKQKWWRWLLLAGLGCLAVESLWASAIEKRQLANL